MQSLIQEGQTNVTEGIPAQAIWFLQQNEPADWLWRLRMEYLSHANLSGTACDRFCPVIFRCLLILKEFISHDSVLTLDTEILYLYLGKLNFLTWKEAKPCLQMC